LPDVPAVAERALASPRTNPLIPDLPDPVTAPVGDWLEKAKDRSTADEMD
jgi:hypothetical protein